MILERLDLIAYGRFSNESIDLSAGPRRFHLVYGPNESGKSTCLRAISALLFGIPTRTTDAYVHAAGDLRIGATLVDRQGVRTHLIRRKNGKSKLNARDDRTPIDPSVLINMLGGIDEDAFHHRFGLSHEQLVAGGQAVLDSKGDVGELLFAAGAGVGQLRAIQSQLDIQCKDLFLERGKKTINVLLTEFDEKRKSLRELQSQPAAYQSLCSQLTAAEQQSDQLARQRKQLGRSLSKCKSYRAACEIVPLLRRDQARLSTLKDVPLLDAEFASRRRDASATVHGQEQSILALDKELQEIDDQLTHCVVDQGILEHEQGIVRMFQMIAAREAACRDQESLHRLVRNHQRHLRDILRDLLIPVDENASQDEVDRLILGLHVSDSTHVQISDLAAEFELLRQQELDSMESLQTQRKQLAELEEETSDLPSAPDPNLIDSLLSEIGNPSVLLDQEEQEQATCGELERQCDELMRELGFIASDLSSTTVHQVPSTSVIDRHEQWLSDRARESDEAEKHLAKLKHQLRDAVLHQTRLQSDLPLPTEPELQLARERRDQCVEQVLDTRADEVRFRSATEDLRRWVHHADHVVDTMRNHQDLVSKRAAAIAEVLRIESEIADAETVGKNAALRLQEAQQHWRDLWNGCGVNAGDIREMRAWIAKHQSLIEKQRTLQKEQTRLDATRRRIERSVSRLANALQQVASMQPIGTHLADSTIDSVWTHRLEPLHDSAIAIRNELVAAANKTQRIRQKRDELRLSIPSAEARYESSVAKRKHWHQQWQKTVAPIAGSADVGPNVINMRLKKIAKLFEEMRERDIVLRRIASIDNDNRQFSEQAAVTADLVALETTPDQRSAQIAQSLYERLQFAKSAHDLASRLKKQRDSRVQQRAEHHRELMAAEAQIVEFCREAKVPDVTDLPGVEQQADEKRRLIGSIHTAEEKLALIADGESIQQIIEQVESNDRAELDSEIESLEQALDSLERQKSTIDQQIGVFQKQLAEIDGGDRAAALNQEMQLLSGRIQRESQQYAKLRIGSMLLQHSIEHYRSENENPVLQIACEAFEELTCGRYSGLKSEPDEKGRPKLYGIERTATPLASVHSMVPVEAMSLGTADAVFLALRLASLEHQLSAGNAIPVVIDDCLIQLDDDRTVAAMKRFSKLSQRTQVILFTHHRHLIDLAAATMDKQDYHLHQLML